MKIKILLLTFSLSFAQYFGANFQIGAALPKGELEAQEVPNAFAIDFNLQYYFQDHVAAGINFGGSRYGFSQRGIPFNQWTNVGLIEETKNYPVSFNGKLRFNKSLSLNLNDSEIKEAIMGDSRTERYLKGSSPKRWVIIQNKIINIVH